MGAEREQHCYCDRSVRRVNMTRAELRCAALIVWLILSGGILLIMLVAFVVPPDIIATVVPECEWHKIGKKCPLCGMTTAFAYMVRGRVLRALAAQPFGAIFCMAVMAAVPASLVVLLTGRGWRVDWYRVTPDRVLWVVLALFLASWGYTVWAAG